MDKTCYYFPAGLLLATSLAAMATTNITTDQSALLALKNHITSDPFLLLAKNWSIYFPVCEWIGVTCDSSSHQRVIALNISNMGFTGRIPPQLGNLSFLVSLDMWNNNFHGNLPEGMSHLHQLSYMDLSNNNFSGEIPSWFGFLDQLQHLSLRNNSFTGFIPLPLFNLSKLEFLRLSSNSIGGKIPEEILNLSNLKKLGIAFNHLTGAIPSTIFKISTLEIISFSGNHLSGVISEEIGNLSKLEEVYLSSNHLVGQISTNLCKCSSLRILSLEFNKLSGSIPREIGNLTLLEILYLNDNILTGLIPNEVSNLFKLEELYLARNSLRGSIPVRIFNISTLMNISLVSNHFFGNLPSNMCSYGLYNLEGLFLGGNNFNGAIPSSISNCSKLTHISIADNKFGGRIPNSIGNLRHLEVLELFENNFTSESSSPELSLFTSLTTCISLRTIAVSSNPLNGVLPISIGNLSSSVERLYAGSCGINGNIPKSIGNLSNLLILNLLGNHLFGSIPTTIRGLQNLQGLFLRNNFLSGSLSGYLCELESLNALGLNQNHISGSIPGCISNLTSLRFLYIAFNKLTSTVPMSLWNLEDLLVIDLSSNFLVGSLPLEVGKLKVLTQLDLSMNHLSGNIPSTIESLQNLIYLSLANNSLQGSIPTTVGNMLSLVNLNLSHNNLSGLIPKSMEALAYLNYLNVSFNDLRGEIPSGGPFKNFTHESFLFNEDLCGATRFHYPPCKAILKNKSRTLKALLPIFVLLGIVVIVGTMAWGFVFVRCLKKREVPSGTNSTPVIAQERISYYELLQATNEYDQSNLLGMGSFGSVYKGILHSGMLVAVKVFNLQVEGAFKSFDAECDILSNLHHRNLTKVITCCSNLDFKALVLEFMPNGSLEKWLYSHNCFLDVMQRLDIMIDVACSLQYLHHGYSELVVHCDLKPSNVLLDHDMVAHVSDFGIAKLLGQEDSIAYTKTLATMGYIAPEYGSEGLVSAKCDVYSYGIMLMEVFTRKKPHDEMFDGDFSLRSWVCGSMTNAVEQVMDTNLLKSSEEYYEEELQCISSIMEVALSCSIDSPRERINIEDALAALKHIKSLLLSIYS